MTWQEGRPQGRLVIPACPCGGVPPAHDDATVSFLLLQTLLADQEAKEVEELEAKLTRTEHRLMRLTEELRRYPEVQISRLEMAVISLVMTKTEVVKRKGEKRKRKKKRKKRFPRSSPLPRRVSGRCQVRQWLHTAFGFISHSFYVHVVPALLANGYLDIISSCSFFLPPPEEYRRLDFSGRAVSISFRFVRQWTHIMRQSRRPQKKLFFFCPRRLFPRALLVQQSPALRDDFDDTRSSKELVNLHIFLREGRPRIPRSRLRSFWNWCILGDDFPSCSRILGSTVDTRLRQATETFGKIHCFST